MVDINKNKEPNRPKKKIIDSLDIVLEEITIRSLKNIRVKTWMSDADVAVQARAPPLFPHWAKIYKVTKNQENEYTTWMAKEALQNDAWCQEYEANQGTSTKTFIEVNVFVLYIF